ncbi:MAG: helix-turn-helix domain-containing protein [Chlorobium sp.]
MQEIDTGYTSIISSISKFAPFLAQTEYSALKECRQSLRLTQKDFAKMIHSSQSRVAKMEAVSPIKPVSTRVCTATL